VHVRQLAQIIEEVCEQLLDENPARQIPNPEPKRREVLAFSSLAEVELVSAELPSEYRAIPIFVALTGLRPEEWIALERRDIDGDVVHVRRVFTDGRVKEHGKQRGSLRDVPLPARAQASLATLPPRLDTPLLFPSRCNPGHLDLASWRRRHWNPAVQAAGLEHRSPYSLRHTYASFAIASGVHVFELARIMGTSVEQIDATYGHMLPDTLARTRSALDGFVAVQPRDQLVTKTIENVLM
jgi:integrase